MSEVVVRCARALTESEERRDFAFAIADGRIAAVDSPEALLRRYPGAHIRLWSRRRGASRLN